MYKNVQLSKSYLCSI